HRSGGLLDEPAKPLVELVGHRSDVQPTIPLQSIEQGRAVRRRVLSSGENVVGDRAEGEQVGGQPVRRARPGDLWCVVGACRGGASRRVVDIPGGPSTGPAGSAGPAWNQPSTLTSIRRGLPTCIGGRRSEFRRTVVGSRLRCTTWC